MRVTKTHHDDRSEPDAAGMQEWAYTYDLFVFEDEGMSLTFRRYSDTPTEACLLRHPEWSQVAVHADVLVRSLQHLRDAEGVSEVRVLDHEHGKYMTLLESISATTALSSTERARLRSAVSALVLPDPALKPPPPGRRG